MIEAADLRPPYPGLRPFTYEETDRFFGREDCIEGLVDLLARQHFLAVLGSSGSGKSSLVKTGLLDALERGLMARAGSRWRIVDFRPGDDPLGNLARALLADAEHTPAAEDVSALRTFLARGPRSLIEWCNDGHLGERENLLLLVDQFEELFRYSQYAEREQAEAFVGLLLESSSLKAGAPVYVVLTMRSEYLGPCALIEGLAERMNTAQFLTPRMTRQQCSSAIEGPAAVCGIAIEPALVNQMLNELANFAPWEGGGANLSTNQLDRLARRADQLPLLQHALNRLWQRAVHGANGSEPGRQPVLRLADYEKIGGVQGALAWHADEVVASLGPERAGVAEAVFRALTTGTSVADAVRRPTLLKDLVEISGAAEADVRAVLDAFRAPGCNFIFPDGKVPLRSDDRIEISHESVIRQWPQLSAWLEKEAQDVQQWRRLCDAAELERTRKAGLLEGAYLQNFLDWRKQANPNRAWAARYGSPQQYDDAIGYLDRSRSAEAARQNRKRLQVAGVVVLAVGIVLGGAKGFEYFNSSVQERVEARLNRERLLADSDVRKDAAETVGKSSLTPMDIKTIFDKGIDRYRRISTDPDTGTNYSKHIPQIINQFVDVYENLPASPGAKPFGVFDTMAQALPPDETDDVLKGLDSLGTYYIDNGRYDLAQIAYTQALDTATRIDRSLTRFRETLTDMIGGIQTSVDLMDKDTVSTQSMDRLYDFGLDYLKRIDPRDQDPNVKTIRGDIQSSKMDVYIHDHNASKTVQAYRAALASYQDAKRKSDDKDNLDNKIFDLQDRYRARNQ